MRASGVGVAGVRSSVVVAVAGCLVLEDEATLLGSNVGGLSREGLEEISVHSAAASLLATSTTHTRSRERSPPPSQAPCCVSAWCRPPPLWWSFVSRWLSLK